MRFLINVLTTHERNGWVHPVLNDFLNHCAFYGHQISISPVHNHMPAAAGRNFAAKHVKEMDNRPDWHVMVDNDMSPPQDILDCVADAPDDAAVVVPIFHMWDEAKPRIVLCWGMDESQAPPTEDGRQQAVISDRKFHRLTKCGTGMIFIRPSVYDKIKMPYFWYPYNELQGIEGTEDLTFCKQILDNGMKIYGNSQYVVGHYHNCNLAVIANLIAKIQYEASIEAESRLAAASPA